MLYLCNFQYTRCTCIPNIYINDLSYNFKWNPRLLVDDTFLFFLLSTNWKKQLIAWITTTRNKELGVPVQNKLQTWSIKKAQEVIFSWKITMIIKESLALVFFGEFCKISKNTFFAKHLRTAASEVNDTYWGDLRALSR